TIEYGATGTYPTRVPVPNVTVGAVEETALDVRNSPDPGTPFPGAFTGAHRPPPVPPPGPLSDPSQPVPRSKALDKIEEIRRTIENARSMPMSASCVVNRTELLEDLAELAELFPAELAE